MAETNKGAAAKRTSASAPTPPAEKAPDAVVDAGDTTELPPAEVPEGFVAYKVTLKVDGSDDPGVTSVNVPAEEQDVEAYIELELGERGITADHIVSSEVFGEGDEQEESDTPTPPAEPTDDERAAALAKLANGNDDEDPAVTEPEVVEVVANGNVIDLSDSGKTAEYLVLKSLFTIQVHGNFRVARKGDVVRLSKDQAQRGLDKGGLRKA